MCVYVYICVCDQNPYYHPPFITGHDESWVDKLSTGARGGHKPSLLSLLLLRTSAHPV